MGEVSTYRRIREQIAAENKKALPSGMIQQYADLFTTYREAALNIARNGAIVQHPKTGQPIENPYLRVRQSTLAELQRFTRVKADAVWEALSAELEAAPS